MRLLLLVALAVPVAAQPGPGYRFDLKGWLDAALAYTAANAADTTAWEEGDDPWGANPDLARAFGAVVNWQADCGGEVGDIRDQPGMGAVSAYQVPTGYVIAISCYGSSSYGPHEMLYFVAHRDDGGLDAPSPIILVEPDGYWNEDGTYRTPTGFVASSPGPINGFQGAAPDGRLEFFRKGVGYGGCGTYLVHQIRDSGVALVEVRARECDWQPTEGNEEPEPYDPATWPVVYRAE